MDKILLVINGLKNFAKYLLIPSGVITFAPDNWLSYIRMLEIKNQWGVWIASAFLLSLSIIAIVAFSKIQSSISLKRDAHNKKIARESMLKKLSNREKITLKLIYENDKYTLDSCDATVDKLERWNITTRPAISVELTEFSYSLHPWVLDYLQKHPDYFAEVK